MSAPTETVTAHIPPAATAHTATVCGANCPVAPVKQADMGTQIADFFTGLFDTKNWPPRWHCGSWSDFHGWLYIVSDLLIWAAYFAIPILLARIVTKRKDLPFPRIIWLFVAFIILCGSTHLIDAIIFWWPAYRLSALVRFATAVVSVFTLYATYKIMPLVLSLRSVEELEREIAERKQVEAKLAENEFLLSEAGRIGRMGGWEFDVINQKSTWSPTVYDIYGVPHDYDMDAAEPFSYYTPASAGLLKDALAEAYENGAGWDLELQMTTAQGQNIWVRSCGECFYDEAGKLSKLRGLFMDINRYKINELALNTSHELLFRSHQQLKTFTHILSHNIRNHASNISLLNSLVNVEAMDEDNRELFDKISKVSHGLNETLNDLSVAIKIREDKMESETLSFRDITANVFEILESEILMNAAKVKFNFSVKTIEYPKLYLESIVMNLLSNAIKYRKPDVAPEVLLKTYTNESGRTVLECRDNGQGINLKLHGDRLFGLYKTFHEHKEAHGVGLFLVKTQVESQGGGIVVESEPGKGTTFKIVF
ncbi:PAS domain-containing protein [Mucilaginibacter mali]|uniref:histidine kinase n=1 Tax=Mucilaginibacter mali TaxID=2740462 RepID=A0A7D4TPK0_9SPHI|nr:ATP-binding protein [Mucilaginibacter mali]QKJ31873.1 PAS domain-containing protein [Mucilaginibacter mali]